MRFLFCEFEFEILYALSFIKVGNLGRAINYVGKFIGNQKLSILNYDRVTCAVLKLPR